VVASTHSQWVLDISMARGGTKSGGSSTMGSIAGGVWLSASQKELLFPSVGNKNSEGDMLKIGFRNQLAGAHVDIAL